MCKVSTVLSGSPCCAQLWWEEPGKWRKAVNAWPRELPERLHQLPWDGAAQSAVLRLQRKHEWSGVKQAYGGSPEVSSHSWDMWRATQPSPWDGQHGAQSKTEQLGLSRPTALLESPADLHTRLPPQALLGSPIPSHIQGEVGH